MQFISNSNSIVYLRRKFTWNIEIFLQLVHDQDLVRGGCYYTLLTQTTLHYESHTTIQIIGPYNDDRIIHNIEKKIMLRDKIKVRCI